MGEHSGPDRAHPARRRWPVSARWTGQAGRSAEGAPELFPGNPSKHREQIPKVAKGRSSQGGHSTANAPRSHRGGRRFNPCRIHHFSRKKPGGLVEPLGPSSQPWLHQEHPPTAIDTRPAVADFEVVAEYRGETCLLLIKPRQNISLFFDVVSAIFSRCVLRDRMEMQLVSLHPKLLLRCKHVRIENKAACGDSS